MAHATKKSIRMGRGRDAFVEDEEIEGEYDNPGPREVDPDVARIATAISEIKKREKTGYLAPSNFAWLKSAGLPQFTAFFLEDKMALDLFNRETKPGAEMDALEPDLTPGQQAEIAKKTRLCQDFGMAYVVLGPDDEFDKVQLAAKLGLTTARRGAKTVRTPGGDGITEEDSSD